MNHLKKSNLIFSVTLILISGCTTPSYRIYNVNDNRTELVVTPDRITVQCEDVESPEEPRVPAGRYGFMIHILDEENTFLNVIRGHVLSKKDCFDQKHHAEKILGNGKQIYLGSMGTLDSPREITTTKYIFPKRGTYFWNGRVLQFKVIQNELGECYDVYYGSKAPCPREEFPIKDHPFIKASK